MHVLKEFAPVTYTLPLALEDFVPVIFGAIGFISLARAEAAYTTQTLRLGILGASLVVLGGLSKASWKLIMAASGGSVDVVWLGGLLFYLLAPGFVLLATALLISGRGEAEGTPPLGGSLGMGLALLVVLGALVLRLTLEGGAHRVLLLGTIVVANTTVLGVAMRRCFARGVRPAAALFGLYLIVGFIMPVLSTREQTIALQWLEQSVNSVGALALAAGGLWLQRRREQAPRHPRDRSDVALAPQ